MSTSVQSVFYVIAKDLTVENAAVAVTLHTGDVTLSVYDKRTGQTWSRQPLTRDVVLKDCDALSVVACVLCQGLVAAAFATG